MTCDADLRATAASINPILQFAIDRSQAIILIFRRKRGPERSYQVVGTYTDSGKTGRLFTSLLFRWQKHQYCVAYIQVQTSCKTWNITERKSIDSSRSGISNEIYKICDHVTRPAITKLWRLLHGKYQLWNFSARFSQSAVPHQGACSQFDGLTVTYVPFSPRLVAMDLRTSDIWRKEWRTSLRDFQCVQCLPSRVVVDVGSFAAKIMTQSHLICPKLLVRVRVGLDLR